MKKFSIGKQKSSLRRTRRGIGSSMSVVRTSFAGRKGSAVRSGRKRTQPHKSDQKREWPGGEYFESGRPGAEQPADFFNHVIPGTETVFDDIDPEPEAAPAEVPAIPQGGIDKI